MVSRRLRRTQVEQLDLRPEEVLRRQLRLEWFEQELVLVEDRAFPKELLEELVSAERPWVLRPLL